MSSVESIRYFFLFFCPSLLTTTIEGNSDRHQEAGEISVESVVSVHESPEPEEGKRDGEKERKEQQCHQSTCSRTGDQFFRGVLIVYVRHLHA